MTKWDYLVGHHVGTQQELADTMANMGREGWELVSASPIAALGGKRETLIYFKRTALEGAEPASQAVIFGN